MLYLPLSINNKINVNLLYSRLKNLHQFNVRIDGERCIGDDDEASPASLLRPLLLNGFCWRLETLLYRDFSTSIAGIVTVSRSICFKFRFPLYNLIKQLTKTHPIDSRSFQPTIIRVICVP
ncbi:hypothetical protein QVD17_32092 [Tagetes erecta]|uniref:Uncharacterized protein n=1 Tax=Tagetes erecta TaxID=13708 RepID=A0AAD8K6W7_TARER|nr:hypothetical protein QVD17_32092 [Tagetes erecta]